MNQNQMYMYCYWQEELGKLREAYVRQHLDTTTLAEWSSKLNGQSSAADIGNAIRKVLDFNYRTLYKSLNGDATPTMLATIVDGLANALAGQPIDSKAMQFMHYGKFIKYFGNSAVHNQVLDELDTQALVPSAIKMCRLLLALIPMPAPHALVPTLVPAPHPLPAAQPKPGRFASDDHPTSTLWIGNVPAALNGPALREMLGKECGYCAIKTGQWNAQGRAIPVNYAFAEFASAKAAQDGHCAIKTGQWNAQGSAIPVNYAFAEFASAKAAQDGRDRLLALERGFEIRFRQPR